MLRILLVVLVTFNALVSHASALITPVGVADTAGTTIFVVNEKGDLDALDIATGKTLWTHQGPLVPFIFAHDQLIAHTFVPEKHDAVTLVALDPATGKQLQASDPIPLEDPTDGEAGWRFTLEVIGNAVANSTVNLNIKFTAAKDRGLRGTGRFGRFNVSTGRFERSDHPLLPNTPDRALPVVELSGRKLQLAEAADGDAHTRRTLRASDAKSGALIWEYSLAGADRPPRAIYPVKFTYGGIADPEGKSGFVRGEAGVVAAIDLLSGKTLWESKSAEIPLIVIEQSLLAVVHDDKQARVVWLDLATGKKQRESDALVIGVLPPIPAFSAQAVVEAGHLRLFWVATPTQQFGAAGMFEARTRRGAVSVALDTGRLSDAVSQQGQGQQLELPFTNIHREADPEHERLNGLTLSVQNDPETQGTVTIHHLTLRAADDTGKIVWEHPMNSYTSSNLSPPRSAQRG